MIQAIVLISALGTVISNVGLFTSRICEMQGMQL